MRFLFTVASYYPQIGGVQKVTQNTAEELVKQGHEVTVLISQNGNIKEYNTLNGVNLLYYPLYTKKDRIVGNVNSCRNFLIDLCKKTDVLINVSVHSALTDAILPYLNKIACKKVLYLHGIYDFKWTNKDKESFSRIASKIYYNIRRRKYYYKLKEYAKGYDKIIHLSSNDASMDYMIKNGVLNNIVIYNSAERAFFEKTKTKRDRRYFLQVANYAEHKNQEFSLESFYKSNCDDVKMIYVGSSKNMYYDKLIDLNKKLSLKYGEKDVEFLVGVEREDLIKLFKNAMAIILSSRVEKFPMVVVEGLACGVPFISTDCGSINNIPGGKVVYSIDEMSQYMEKYLNNTTELEKLIKEGQEYSEKHFSLERNVKKLLNELELI